MAQQQAEVTIRLDDVTMDRVLAELPKYGVQQVEPDEFGEEELTLAAAVVIVGTANALAFLVTSVINWVRGGTVVDLTGDRPDVRGDRDVPRGWMVVLTRDGKVELKKEDLPPDGLERVVTRFLELGKDATTAAIEATAKAVKSGVKTKSA